MMKKIIAGMLGCLLSTCVWAQHALTVVVRDAQQQKPLQGATVRLPGMGQTLQTNAQGEVQFKDLRVEQVRVEVRFLGYQTQVDALQLTANTRHEVMLMVAPVLADDVLVQATRAQNNTPTTFKNITKAELAKNNLGPDLVYLLDQTPSVVVTSDAGAGVGYTGIRVRGSDPTRVNVTINGIPLNNPESMGAFLVNLPDFASSVDNIQIQRGVGTSTNGAGAFGASLNIQTTTLEPEPYVALDHSAGSYATYKNTVRVGTGLLNDRVSFDARLSQIQSDGYMDRASSDLKSFFLTGAWHGKNSLLRANVFSGQERTYQAWNGVPEEMLSTNRRYNEFTYENQIDHYTQTHYQLHYSQQLNTQWQYNAALHYTKGAGYYEEYKEGEALSKYQLLPVSIGGDTLYNTDLVRRRWLDNDFYGATGSVRFTPNARAEWTLGGAYNEYKGAHFGEVIWAQYASNGKLGDRYYEDDAVKKDGNLFLRSAYQWGAWHLFGDLQYRYIQYTFLGYNRNLQQMDMTDRLHFFNPKAGVSYQVSPNEQWYVSYALANKEPIRDDYTDSSEDSRPKPERLHNVELGYKKANAHYQFGANLYGMYYQDQLIITGEINDVGGVVRQNVDKSYRAGIELDGVWRPSAQFQWAATATFSRNQILDFTEFVDLEDYSDAVAFHYDRTHIAMSPEWIASSTLTYRPWRSFEMDLISKYVSRQYLDNSSQKSRSLDPYMVHNLRLAYNTSYKAAKEIGLTLMINNLFNELYSSNGYTFGNIDGQGQRVAYNYYYPQATTHFLFGLHLKF